MALKYQRILLKISGEALGGEKGTGFDEPTMDAICGGVKKAHELGVNPGIDPFMTLSFMALPVIPSLRITTRGVFDVTTQRYV